MIYDRTERIYPNPSPAWLSPGDRGDYTQPSTASVCRNPASVHQAYKRILTINENADPDVQTDMEAIFNRLVKEREPYYQHTCEGDDDMPAHAKATLSGTSLTIPITNGRLNIGIWQGIYLCEFRNRGGGRRIVATVIG